MNRERLVKKAKKGIMDLLDQRVCKAQQVPAVRVVQMEIKVREDLQDILEKKVIVVKKVNMVDLLVLLDLLVRMGQLVAQLVVRENQETLEVPLDTLVQKDNLGQLEKKEIKVFKELMEQ